MTVEEIAVCLGLAKTADRKMISGVATDSRHVRPGDLFVCLTGEHVDGHDFAKVAADSGASAILASKPLCLRDMSTLYVENTELALGKIAAEWRKRFTGKTVCITGTSGKTTVKDCLASILAMAGKTAKTDKNHNNQIGLPLSILAADGDEKFWVLEAGISHAGDMDYLGAIARPDLAVIINVGAGHTEGLGARGVAWHKTRLLKHLAQGGQALVCADYPDLVEECAKEGIRPQKFSLYGPAGFRMLSQGSGDGEYVFELAGASCPVRTPYFGEYGAENALAAASAASLLGISGELIRQGLSNPVLPQQRFSLSQYAGWHMFDDTYNANPLSMRRMLQAAASFAKSKKLPFVAVLGEMGELGAESCRWHRELGRWLAELHPAVVFWNGGHYADVNSGYTENDKNIPPAIQIADPAGFEKKWLSSGMPQKGVIIFKGSRLNKMEKFLPVFANIMTGRKGFKNVL